MIIKIIGLLIIIPGSMRFLRLHINRCTCQKIYTRGNYGAIFGAPFLGYFTISAHFSTFEPMTAHKCMKACFNVKFAQEVD